MERRLGGDREWEPRGAGGWGRGHAAGGGRTSYGEVWDYWRAHERRAKLSGDTRFVV